MTHAESLQWVAYINKRGSLNVGRRLDRGFAMLTKYLLTVNGHKAEIEDFLPKTERVQDEYIAKPEDVLNLFRAISKRNEQLATKRTRNGK